MSASKARFKRGAAPATEPPFWQWLRANPDFWNRNKGRRVAFHETRREMLAVGDRLADVLGQLNPEDRADSAVIFIAIPPQAPDS